MSSIIESISKHLVTKWYLYILRKHRKCEEKHEIIATTKLRNPHSSEVRVVEKRVRRSNEFFLSEARRIESGGEADFGWAHFHFQFDDERES